MFWPILECSIVTTGLWFARRFVPHPLMAYADVIALACIIAMFVWLARRAWRRGVDKGLTKQEGTLDRVLTNFDQSGGHPGRQ